jgi:hypothetical protein
MRMLYMAYTHWCVELNILKMSKYVTGKIVYMCKLAISVFINIDELARVL